MRWTTQWMMVLVLFGVSVEASESGLRERIFLQGLEAFDRAKNDDEYRRAAQIFDSLVQDGIQNGAVYYNLGNAWMKAAEYGRAIAAYRKAQPLRPRDTYLQANLNQALAAAPGRISERPPVWWLRLFFWKDWFSPQEKFYSTSALALLAFVLAMVALRWNKISVPIWRGVWVLVGMTFLSGFETTLSTLNAQSTPQAVVIKETIARKGNSVEYQPAFDQSLKDGAEFSIVERRGDWVLGHFESVGVAWVPRDAMVE